LFEEAVRLFELTATVPTFTRSVVPFIKIPTAVPISIENPWIELVERIAHMTPSASVGTGVVLPLGVFTGAGVGSGIKSSFLQDETTRASEQSRTNKLVFEFFIKSLFIGWCKLTSTAPAIQYFI
jgi:hypothetical protein